MARHTFQVENIQQGLEQIKNQLGPSAIIVKTRRVMSENGKQMLEITAESDDVKEKRSTTPAADTREQAAEEQSSSTAALHSSARAITQLQKTILALTEQVQRVQSEMRHLRMEVHSTQQALLQEETSIASDESDPSESSPSPSSGGLAIQFSPTFFESLHADELRALRLALTQLRDQSGDRHLFETLVEIHAALLAQDVLPIHADMFCARLLGSNRLGTELFESARHILSETLISAPEPWLIPSTANTDPQQERRLDVQLFIGPAGSGKTSMVAKVAAHAAIKASRQIALVSTDAFRIGSHDQLETYAELIGIPFASADGVPLLERTIDVLLTQHPDLDLIIVDATSYVPFEEDASEDTLDTQTVMNLMESEIKDLISIFIVLPATWSTRSLLEYLSGARALKPSGVIWTMLDVTRRFGAIYSVIRDVAIPTVLYSTGRSVPGALATPEHVDLADAILMNKHTI